MARARRVWGAALAEVPELAQRCVISTKAGETFSGGQSVFDFSADAIKLSVERSLRRLQRDCLDIVLLHSSGADLDILQAHKPLRTLQSLQSQGLIKACGFSGKTLAGGERALAEGADVLMITLNARNRAELPLLAAAKAAGAGVLIKKPLASGHGSVSELSDTIAHSEVSAIVSGTLSIAHLQENAAAVIDGSTGATRD